MAKPFIIDVCLSSASTKYSVSESENQSQLHPNLRPIITQSQALLLPSSDDTVIVYQRVPGRYSYNYSEYVDLFSIACIYIIIIYENSLSML